MPSSSPTTRAAAYSLIQLVVLLLLLPALATYFHLQWVLRQHYNLIFVSPPASGVVVSNSTASHHDIHNSNVFGIYYHAVTDGTFGRIIPIHQLYYGSYYYYTYHVWSIASLTTFLAKTDAATRELAMDDDDNQNHAVLRFQDPQQQCFVLSHRKSQQQQQQQQQQQPRKQQRVTLIEDTFCRHDDKNNGSSKNVIIYAHQPHDAQQVNSDGIMRPFHFLQVTWIPLASRDQKRTSSSSLSSSSSWWPNWRVMVGLGPSDFRLNPNRFQQPPPPLSIQHHPPTPQHPLLDQLLHRPATTLLLLLNVVLCFVYWNRKVSPHAVAINYHAMVHQYEWWRCWTGALAHFDVWHVGFNMMTLHALGHELEPRFGSIPFLFYNVSLMPMTAAMFLGIGHLQQHQQQRAAAAVANSNSSSSSLHSTVQWVLSFLSTAGDTVGYSGVLFAWLVVASLEQEQTCPISFLPHLCFRTYRLMWGTTTTSFKLSAAPWVSLIVTQLMLPKRVSLVGHLSGILAGFLLHWNAFPLDLFQPSVLVPYALVVGQWWWARHLIPIPKVVTTATSNTHGMTPNTEVDAEAGVSRDARSRIPSVNTTTSHRHVSRLGQDRQLQKDQTCHHRLLQGCQVSMVVFLMGSLLIVKRPWSSIILSYGAATVIFHFGVCSHARLLSSSNNYLNHHPMDAEEKQRLSVLWKGFVVVSVLTMVVDAMTMASMLVLFGQQHVIILHNIPVTFLAVRAIGLLAPLTLACNSMNELHDTTTANTVAGVGGGGIFAVTLGDTVVTPARTLGEWISQHGMPNRLPSSVPFQGQGIVLGSTRREVSPLS